MKYVHTCSYIPLPFVKLLFSRSNNSNVKNIKNIYDYTCL